MNSTLIIKGLRGRMERCPMNRRELRQLIKAVRAGGTITNVVETKGTISWALVYVGSAQYTFNVK